MNTTATEQKQAEPSRPNWLRRLVWGVLALVLLPPLLLSLLLAGLDTRTGRDWLVQAVNRTGVVRLGQIEGSLWSEMAVNRVRVDTEAFSLEADRIELAWMPYALLIRQVHLSSLKAGRIDIALKPAPPDQPVTPAPQDLRLPIAFALDQAKVASLHVQKPELAFSDIRFSLATTGRQHRFELAQLVARQGRAQAMLAIDGKAPFVTSGRFDFRGEVEGNAIHTRGEIAGKLRDLNLSARVDNPQANGRIDAQLDLFAPYAYQMLREGRIELDRINPARMLADLPQAELDILLDLRPTGEASAQGRLAITNHRAGAINAGLIPLENLQATLAYSGEELHFSGLDAVAAGGRIQGSGKIGAGRLDLDFDIARLDLAQIWLRQPATLLDGKLGLSGPWLAPDIRAELEDARHQASLQADLGWINPQKDKRLQIRKAEIRRGASRFQARGELGLMDKLDFRLAGEFSRLNPAEFVAVPAGSLSGSLEADGHLQPKPRISLDYRLTDSRFNGESLQGQGRIRLEEARLADADFWLMLGRNRVDARGALGARNDVLQATLDVPALQSLGRGFSGSARGQLKISGTYTDPVLDSQVSLAGLVTPFGFAAKSARIDARLQQGLDAPLRLDLEAAQLRYGEVSLEQVQARIDGSRSKHVANIALNGGSAATRLQLQAVLAGGLDAGWNWLGTLQRFDLDGPQSLRLSEPATLQAGSARVSLGDSRWQLGRSQIRLQHTSWQPGALETRGEFSQLAVSDWLKTAGARDFSSDLVFGGNWQLLLDQDLRDLNGFIEVRRESGDSLWRGPPGNRIPFELRDVSVRVDARHNRIELDGLAQSSRYGRLSLAGNARVDPAGMQIAEGSVPVLQARGELPQLAAFNPLLGPDLQLGGRLAFDIRREGLLQTTRVSGNVLGDELAIRDLATGLSLREGVVRMALADQRISLEQAIFKGGQGSLSAEGTLDLRGESPSGQVRIEARRLTLFSRSDMLLVLSGNGDLSSRKGQISISGKLRADQGDIEYRSADIPKLSEDVIVIGRERPPAKTLPDFSLAMDVDLGNDFRFRGYGLDTRLEGLLRLRAQPARSLSAHGVVQVTEGTYRAWGQRLEIERGQLSFQGPVDNPGLDILAMRRDQEVEAGVSVLGTVLRPRVQLYSEPSVPDTEKLSWLLFGHGTEGMEASDSALLLQAAHSLLAGDGQKGFAQEIFETIAIDDVGMRSVQETTGQSTQIVTVSKRIGRKLRVSLEKSINGLRDAVKFTLQLSRRWSFVTRVGNDESTVGATYTVQYD